MATLFRNISDVKKFVGGGANTSMAIESLTPALEMAAQEYVTPWVGDTVWNTMLANYPDSLTTEQEALLPYLQRPVALLAMHEYAKVGNVQFNENGMHRIETEYQKSAYKYQENEYKKWMLEQGFNAIEMLLNFLEDNQVSYPEWSSSYQAKNRALFINTAAIFKENYSKSLSRYTFEMMRTLIEDVELFAIKPLIGTDQYDALKTAISAKTETSEQSDLIIKIRKAVAYFSVQEALKHKWVSIDGNRLSSYEQAEAQGYETANIPTAEGISLSIRSNDEMANRHISNITQFLDDNIADYPLYAAFIEAQAVADSDTESHLTGEDCCNSRDDIGCYKTTMSTRKGVIRL